MRLAREVVIHAHGLAAELVTEPAGAERQQPLPIDQRQRRRGDPVPRQRQRRPHLVLAASPAAQWMSAIDFFGLLVPVTYLAMLGIEGLFQARQFPRIPYWHLKGFCFMTVQGLLATLTPLLIPERWLQA